MFGVLMLNIVLLILEFVTGFTALIRGFVSISLSLAFIIFLQMILTFQIKQLYENEKTNA